MEKRAADGIGISRRSSTLPYRDPNHKNGHIQCCNRIGCSTRLYATEGSRIGDQEKARNLKASSRSVSSSKTISGNTSRSVSTSSDCRKPCPGQRKPTSTQEMTSTETLESSDTKSTSRKQTSRHWEFGFQDPSPSSSGQSLASKNTRQTNKHNSQIAGSVAHKHGIRNVSSRAVPDFIPAGCSSSHSGSNRRIDMVRKGTSSEGMVRKRPSSGEISTARGKTVASGGYSVSRQRGLSAPSPSQSERSVPQQTSSRYRKPSVSRSGAGSVRTRLAPSVEARYPEQGRSSFSLSVPTMASELPLMQFSTDSILPESSSGSFTNGLSSTCLNPTGWPSSSSQSAHNSPVSHSEDGSAEHNGALGDWDGYRRLTTAGVAEVLLALERIEQNEDLTYEELLVLESNLSIGDLAFYDQHRDMRLDIDNMSYEELLALTEEMGTVSTALTEEALSRCLNISIYGSLSVDPRATDREDNDIKCSICQEEYAVGDEVGRLACEHLYHAGCIYQWLRQKNWCPICKAAACTS